MLRIIFGDRVTARRLGQPIVGTADGFVKAWPYAQRCYPEFDFSQWDEHYPNWRDGTLVFVLLDNPICDCECGTPNYYVIYPEEDLVVFDDDFAEGLGKSALSREVA